MMNDRITLQKPGAGAGKLRPAAAWEDIATVWADVKFPSGIEVVRAGAEASIVKCSIRIRARAGIDNSCRVLYKGTAYDVESALPEDRDRRFMFLVCKGVS
ncbi:phage head closure protein [Massilia sp. YIM B02443]|uniref:phage head closure protein n=1 Tax=Massilia sp. YIM B02443 TaxID=3050127 RepID=UPI0025B6CCB3|nr:phage head closure protein [Massilia sp. YIM B02443]MDN4040191.1 phage head closure protein [Massilia sp. YIM B02443]